MRRPVHGWRSHRAWNPAGAQEGPSAGAAGIAAGAGSPPTFVQAFRRQSPFRMSLSFLGVVVYLWVIHSYKLAIGDVAVIAALVGVFLRPGKIEFPWPLVTFTAFALWAATGLAVSRNFSVTYTEVVELVKVLVVVFVLVNAIRSATELRFLTIAWLGIFALYPLRGAYYNQFICHCAPAGRVSWNFVFQNPNDLAALSFLPLGLAAVVALLERDRLWRYLALGGLVFLSLLIFLTQSRGALIALGVAALIVLLRSRKRGRDLVIVAAVGAVVAFAAPKSVWDRLAGLQNVSIQSDMGGVDAEGSAEERWAIWKIAGRVIELSPVTGVGLGMYPYHHFDVAQKYAQVKGAKGYRDAHSTYLRVTAETGVVGLLLYLAMWFAVFRYTGEVRRVLRHVRPGEYQALVMLELSLMALLIAAIFGSFGVLVYAYLHMGAVILVARVLREHRWPVRSVARAPETRPMPSRAMA